MERIARLTSVRHDGKPRWCLAWVDPRTRKLSRRFFEFKEDAAAYARGQKIVVRRKGARTARSKGTRAKQTALKKGVVYFARSPRTRYTKIGFTIDPKTRLRALRTSDPKIEFVIELGGTVELERWLHKHFAQRRVEREWFDLDERDLWWVRSGGALKAYRGRG